MRLAEQPDRRRPFKSLQLADIGGDGLDLRRCQIVGDGLHDRRGVGIGLVLAALLFPVGQLSVNLVMQLTREPRKSISTLSVRPMTGSAGRDVGAGNAFFVDLLSVRREFFRRAAQRFRIEVLEIACQGFDHPGIQNVRHVEHHGIRPPAFDKCLQLIRDIFRLLARESRHREGSPKALPVYSVAGLAIISLGLERLCGNARRCLALRMGGRRDNRDGESQSGGSRYQW